MKKLLTRLCILFLWLAGSLWAEPVFIVGPKVSIKSISRHELDKILKGRQKSWPTGERIQLVLMKEGHLHESILSSYASMNDSQFSSHWNSLVFTGKVSAPKSFATEADVIRFVATNDYALGYAERAHLAENIQILKIE